MSRSLSRLAISTAVLLFATSARPTTLLRFTCDSSMQTFGERLSDWYAKKNPAVHFQFTTARTAESFAAMASGKAEVVPSTRRPLHSEEESLRSLQGKKYVSLQVATEIAGIAVNESNPVKELSLFQLRQVLSGSVKNWKQIGGPDAPIVIYGRDDSSDVRAFLEEEFMGDENISSSAKTFATNSAMLAAVGRDPNGIGFGTAEPAANGKIRFLRIKPSESGEGVGPTTDAIRAKRYKLVRPLYFCFAGTPSGDMAQFAQWILSPEGQLVVEAVGYYPLSSSEREEGLRLVTAK